jgi:hypothetical protein
MNNNEDLVDIYKLLFNQAFPRKSAKEFLNYCVSKLGHGEMSFLPVS